MEILSIILNFILGTGLAGTFIFFRPKRREAHAHADNAEIENTEKIIHLQAEHIDHLDSRVEKLEEKVDKLEIIIDRKDSEIDRKQLIIRQAYKCSTPAEQCPVLIKRAELERRAKEEAGFAGCETFKKQPKKRNHEPRTTQPESGQHPDIEDGL